ncbi:hypothetical protein M2171_004944 [Bradyrhizobium japonicum USDA 38]|uniref:hypothetical protein n=1 Tax=Bradyrhizobium japonicum TaxID=375 RepID=UPI000423DBB2|nr:hypothetical protein [Bradyrhizobium japonicum]MCS3895811.1 hypothetical protein [Bradyrhizobium japonicum USDA 38]MCS3948326.1 hypothetical protein [Bradyrhizobium japonicum]
MRASIKAIALVAALCPGIVAAQVYLPPNVGLPPQSVIGNALPQAGDAVAVSFAQIKAALNVPALTNCPASQWVRSLAAGGIVTCSRPALTDISGFGTNVTTFLATPISANLAAAVTDETGTGSLVFATSPTLVTPNLGTPSTLILTNATGLPFTGITGLGTGVATALGLAANTAGGIVTSPATISSISGLGTGVGTALGVNVGTAGAFVVNGGALGTPASGNGSNLTALTATNISTGTLPAARTNGHMNGEPSTGNAAAGEVGEIVTSTVAIGSAVALTTGTPTNITSISLTAGDWDVSGAIGFIPGVTTNVTQFIASASATSATFDTAPGRFFSFNLAPYVPGAAQQNYSVPVSRFSLSGTTTVFLVAQSAFTVSTMGGFGNIRARRVR